VPGLIRALAGPNPERQEALEALHGNIWHQGTVYEASARAVPFLVELVAQPELEGRADVLGLIAALADGQSYLAVHASAGEFGAPLRSKPDFEARLATELVHVARVGAAIRAHRDFFERLLLDPDAIVRAAAFHVLSRPAVGGAAALEAAIREADPLARAAMFADLASFGDRGPAVLASLEAEVRGARDHRVRFAAALSLHRLSGPLPEAAHAICRAMAAAPWFAEAFLSGLPWDDSAVPQPLLHLTKRHARHHRV